MSVIRYILQYSIFNLPISPSPHTPHTPYTPHPPHTYLEGLPSPNFSKRAIAILTPKIKTILKDEPKPQF